MEQTKSGSASLPVDPPLEDPFVSGVAGERRRGTEPLQPLKDPDAEAVGVSPPAAVAGSDAAAAAGVDAAVAAQQAGAS